MPSLDALLDVAARERVTVVRSRLDARRGAWSAARRIIWIDSRLSDAHAAPVLAHELIHARRGDDCVQDDAAEQLIDERVAQAFIMPEQFAAAERIHGDDSWAIAEELDLPAWVIDAYRRFLARVA